MEYPPRVTCATARGPRDYQQDRFLAVRVSDPEGLLIVVTDGHGDDGEYIAEHCTERLPSLLHETKGPIEGRISDAVMQLCEETKDTRAGTTLSAVHVVGDTAYVAFLGDSPIIVRGKDGKVSVSDEHNVRTNKKERDEAIERGGLFDGIYIYNASGNGLQVGRALGNARLGKIIRREPEHYSVALGPKSVIVVCSDGLLDPVHGNTQALIDDMMPMVADESRDAQYLLAWAESRRLRDNATVVVYRHS